MKFHGATRWNRVSLGYPRNFNTQLTALTRKINSIFLVKLHWHASRLSGLCALQSIDNHGCWFSVSITFSTRSSSLQILRNSSRHHRELMLLSLSSVTNRDLRLFVGCQAWPFCAECILLYRCLQMEWWAAVTVSVIDWFINDFNQELCTKSALGFFD